MKRILIACLALPLVACGTTPISAEFTGVELEPEATGGPEPVATPEQPVEAPPAVVPADSETLLGCADPTQRWFNEQGNWWIDTGWLGILGNDQFVVHSQQINNSETLLRVSDGAVAGGLLTPVAIEYDDAHNVGVYWMQEAFEVRDVASQQVLQTIEMPGGSWQTYRVEMSPDGHTVATARCSENGANLEIDSYELASGVHRTWSVPTNDAPFCPGWASHNAIPFDVAADTVITAEPGTGAALVLSTVDGSSRTVAVHPEDMGEDQFWYEQPVLDVAVHPDGTEFATSGLDGTVRRWRLDDLTMIDERDASWIVVNTQTYTTPFAVSPIVYSHDGNALAYTATDERAGVVSLRTGEDAIFVPTGAGDAPEHWADWRPSWGIAELGFAPDDRSLIVVESGGTQLFGCPLNAATEPRALEVEVTAERTTRIGEAWSFDVEVVSGHELVGAQWSLDGVQLAPLQYLQEWRWVFTELGAHTFRLVLDDGLTTAEEVLEIEVLP